jgi:hypothetical protein
LFFKSNRRVAALVPVICVTLLIFYLVGHEVRHALPSRTSPGSRACPPDARVRYQGE